MKKVLLLAVMAMFLSSSLYSQDKLSFSTVIQVDSTQKQFIYNGIKEWFGMNFVSAKNIIEVDDKDAGLIIANALTNYSYGKLSYICYDGYLKYTLKIQIKDGRFRVELTNFVHQNKIGNSESCIVGFLTNDIEYTGVYPFAAKSYSQRVWNDCKSKAEILSNDLFLKLGNIKFSTNKTESKADNW